MHEFAYCQNICLDKTLILIFVMFILHVPTSILTTTNVSILPQNLSEIRTIEISVRQGGSNTPPIACITILKMLPFLIYKQINVCPDFVLVTTM